MDDRYSADDYVAVLEERARTTREVAEALDVCRGQARRRLRAFENDRHVPIRGEQFGGQWLWTVESDRSPRGTDDTGSEPASGGA